MIDQSILDFFKEVEKVRSELRCSNSGVFYRGHSHKSHKLVPSLLRSNFSLTIEQNLYIESYARGRSLMNKSENSWEFLSIMQHYGIPTRLLDWSESLATALFFALSDSYSEPQIWITNAFELNKKNNITDVPKIITVGKDDLEDYEECFISHVNTKSWKFDKPVFLQIPWTNERIINQKGFFTFHPNSTPMEDSCRKYVKCISIKKEAIPSLKRFLEYSGVGDDNIYADLESFGKHLKKRYNV